MSVVHIRIDMRIAAETLERLLTQPLTIALCRHFQALLTDDAAFDLRPAPAGSDCTHRLVPSIQLLRLVEQHESRV